MDSQSEPIENEIAATSCGLPLTDIPDVMTETDAEELGYTARIKEEEIQENTAVFQNADGTNTMYFFAQDIWFTNENGEKEDYNTDIIKSETGYENISGDKRIIFPEKLSDGIVYSEKGFTITAVPSKDSVVSNPIKYENEPIPEEEIMSSEEIEEREKSGEYDDIINQPEVEISNEELDNLFDETKYNPYSEMGENTVEEHNPTILDWLEKLFEHRADYNEEEISYSNVTLSPLLHGVKQNVEITSPEQNSYSFNVSFDGLVPLNSTGCSIPLADKTGKIRGYINTECDIDCPQIIDIAMLKDGTYLVTVTLDREYLGGIDTTSGMIMATSATTFTISDYYIYDTYVYSASPSTNFNSATILRTGYAGGTCRTYIKFLIGSAFNYINPDSIIQEYLMLSTYYTSSSTSITPYIPNLTWNNATLTWNISTAVSPPYTSTRNGVPAQGSTTVTMQSNAYNSIKLNTNGADNGLMAAFIREGINPNLSKTIAQDRGIVLINSNNSSSSYCASFKSANHSTGLPYVTVSYNNPNVSVTSVSVSPSSTTVFKGYTTTLTAAISPSNATNKSVVWTSSNADVATVSSTGVVTGVNPGVATITVRTVDGGKEATCTVTVNPNSSAYQDVPLYTEYTGNITEGRYFWYKFTPTATNNYAFFGTGSANVKLTVFSGASSENVLGDANQYYSLTMNLVSDTEYLILVQGQNSASTGTYSLNICDVGDAREYINMLATEANSPNCAAYAVYHNSGYISVEYYKLDESQYTISYVGTTPYIFLTESQLLDLEIACFSTVLDNVTDVISISEANSTIGSNYY